MTKTEIKISGSGSTGTNVKVSDVELLARTLVHLSHAEREFANVCNLLPFKMALSDARRALGHWAADAFDAEALE